MILVSSMVSFARLAPRRNFRRLLLAGASAAFSMPLGLSLGASLETFEARNLLAQLRVLCLQPGYFLQSLHQQRLQLFEA